MNDDHELNVLRDKLQRQTRIRQISLGDLKEALVQAGKTSTDLAAVQSAKGAGSSPPSPGK